MTEKLDNLLATTLQKFLDGVDATTQFASEQLPDVITQLLVWYGIYYFILLILGIIILGLFYYGSYKWITVVEPTLSFNIRWMGTGFGVCFGGTLLHFAVLIGMFNLTWLKIWLAPKLFLIEYASSLVK